ncbi:TetR/AcrR family transcriptional regulator [Micrococcales bacterium 31B]|nr:TetR/AcrR family transcriptional regulator [Micrococcales bacterium 31B]
MAPLYDQILDCVIALMREGGAASVSIRIVAARAGVSIGAVQHHFPDKAALMLAAQGRVNQEFTESIIASSVPSDSLVDRALRLARAVAGLDSTDLDAIDSDQSWRDRAATRGSFAALAAASYPASEEHTAANQDIEDVFYALIAHAWNLDSQWEEPDAGPEATTVAPERPDGQVSARTLAAAARLRAQALLALAEGLGVAGASETGRVTPQIAGYLLEQGVAAAFEPHQ